MQSTGTNQNSAWLNLRGSWITNMLVVILLRIGFSIIPGLSSELGWTLTILSYNTSTFIMFHGLIGTPFDVDQNQYGNFTLWEQIDGGDQFTPTKKYLTAVPVFLFLISTHYTKYDWPLFILNLASTLVVVIAKLPLMHRVRLFGINKGFNED